MPGGWNETTCHPPGWSLWQRRMHQRLHCSNGFNVRLKDLPLQFLFWPLMDCTKCRDGLLMRKALQCSEEFIENVRSNKQYIVVLVKSYQHRVQLEGRTEEESQWSSGEITLVLALHTGTGSIVTECKDRSNKQYYRANAKKMKGSQLSLSQAGKWVKKKFTRFNLQNEWNWCFAHLLSEKRTWHSWDNDRLHGARASNCDVHTRTANELKHTLDPNAE